jgi:hypothetical protein
MRKVGREREGPSGVIKCPLIGYGPKGEVVPARVQDTAMLRFCLSLEEDSSAR